MTEEQITLPAGMEKEELIVLRDAQFNTAIKTLLYYQHKIEDVANVATRFITEARGKYNYFHQQYIAFLREYAKEHLKRNKDGEIKGKSYKSIAAGGGVFFRAKPEKITFDPTKLAALQNFLAIHSPEKADLITAKFVYEIIDKEQLLMTLQEIADTRAKKILDNPEEIKVGQVAGMQEILDEFNIQVEEADPFYYCYIGSNKGWTGRDLQSNLSQAISGTLKFDQEQEIDLLLEDLSG
jgi:hypothetical protein